MNVWGNPSSVYKEGSEAKALLRQARLHVAQALEINPLEVVFTSGGSESNNHAIKGVFESLPKEKNRYIFSAVEHPSVQKLIPWLKAQGAEVLMVPVDSEGRLDEDVYKSYLNDKVALVSIMYANNETGHIFPIQRLCEMAHSVKALFHSDMVQALGKEEFSLKDLNVDLASFSAHKFYALRGCGVLYVKKLTPTKSLIVGGGQERGRRAGTENLLSILAFAKVCSWNIKFVKEKKEHVRKLRDFLENTLESLDGVRILGKTTQRISNTSHFLIEGVFSETLLINLDLKGFSVSAGAACSSGHTGLSPVLLAMGFDPAKIQSSLRVSLSWDTQKEEVDFFCQTLEKEVSRLRQLR